MALGADPEVGMAVGGDAGQAGMGLDIALVRLLGLVGVLDDDVIPAALYVVNQKRHG